MNDHIKECERLLALDWLQYGDEFDSDRAQNTLNVISSLRTKLDEARELIGWAQSHFNDPNFKMDFKMWLERAQKLIGET